jgi:nicotinamide mononucleotide transporter
VISFFNLILEQFQQQSLLELIAVALSVLYVIFAARQSILCWPCAFISTGLFMYLFWDVTLLFQMLLNFYYIVMAIVGYMFWQGGKSKKALKVSTMAISTHAFLIVFGLVITLLLTLLAKHWFASDWVWLDAGTAVFSVIATLLTAGKKIDNWVYWGIINPASAYLMFQSGLYLTCALMVFYTAMSVYGFLNWRKELN